MFCTECGRALPSGTVACTHCTSAAAVGAGNYVSLQKGAQALRTTARTFLVLGIVNIIVGIVLMAIGWFPGFCSIVIGIIELIKASTYWATPPKSTSRPTWLAILEMVNVLTGASLWGLIGGISNLQRLNSPEVKAYLAAVEAGVAVPVAVETGVAPAVDAGRPTRRCPACAEDILLEATVCRFCGRTLTAEESARARQEHDDRTQAAVSARKRAAEAERQQRELRRVRGRITRRMVWGIILVGCGAFFFLLMVAMFFSSPSPGTTAEQQKTSAAVIGVLFGLAPLGIGIGLVAAARSIERASRTEGAPTSVTV